MIGRAVLILAILALLCGCQTMGGSTGTLQQVLSYACPVIQGFEESSFRLNASQKNLLDQASTMCGIFYRGGVIGTNQAAAATLIVQASILVQDLTAKKKTP